MRGIGSGGFGVGSMAGLECLRVLMVVGGGSIARAYFPLEEGVEGSLGSPWCAWKLFYYL